MVSTANFRPRDGIELIPDDWEARHKPVVDGSRTAVVEVWAGPAAGEKDWTYDSDTKKDVENHGSQLFASETVTARIQRLAADSQEVVGGQKVTHRRYLVPMDREIAEGLTTRTRLRVVECSDPLLEGVYLYVQDIQKGSLRWERDLVCLENL